MGSKEEECRQKALAILKIFGSPETNARLAKKRLSDRVIALEEHILAEGQAILSEL